MIKVLVVDDSAFMRKAISTMLDKDPSIVVVGVARDGQEGLNMVRELDPDVVTMDIEMPKMDGLTALRHIMMESPRPVLMVSSLTTEGAQSTLKAMELGAVDFIPKQLSKVSLDIIKIEKDLIEKVKAVAARKMRHVVARTAVRPKLKPAAPFARPTGRPLRDVVVIGVSTGGPPVVQKILSSLPADFPAGIVIAQHMPAAFTGPFAARLDSVSNIKVKEAETGDVLKAGHAFVAPGGRHVILDQKISRIDLIVSEEPREALYKPSANVLISSAAEAVGRRGLGVILTGMGNDGCEGIRDLKAKGGRALAQSDSTCVVYGMPKAVVDENLVDEVVDLDDMAESIIANLFK
ncbi:chemotaxis response regulator protein-glutamate methylesterase [Pseudodesulfovibrio sp. S3]|uniref:protein-glutamate methylesterase/protein-glutamine glutaminase n=1 Tax=unclassified Pseudodesulfovibrio TaxID=2661612 RepID=UPI000FEB9CAC|nr:chemotaxis response regulator protein-glutamate methylesterase [Pseudodesulfovibrio sp. S3]MCJ2163286.1 chemotaxis response regulator protein-glutamate methylesterase [Pseudodesulfovibrio sp. S3-i]RWU07265.1 chemotaxis response regulator protein-glutamate methylesterase [Pseudodesulfovibrio sp. S3]